MAAAAISIAALSGCGGGDNSEDTPVTHDLILPDLGATDTNVQDVVEDVPQDSTITDQGQPDAAVDDGMPDTGVDLGPVDTGYDPGQPDIPPEDTYVPPSFECDSLKDCQPYEVCDLSLGRCEERSSYTMIVGNEDLFTFKPPEGGYGDFVVIDGSRFMYGMTQSVRADIGGSLVASATLAHSTISPHRIIGPVPNEGGKVGVVFQQATPIYQKFPDEFVYNTNLAELPCDDSTPRATGVDGALGDVGPHAAGYVDFVNDDVRIYYPAECGSIRRPGVAGTYPVVIIVPEGADINVPFLNFDYIGQMLASWGIVVVNIKAEVNSEAPEAHLTRLIAKAPEYVNADLGPLHAALEGVSTSDKMAWLVFGSGADTLNQALAADGADPIKNLATASIAIAPTLKLQDNGASTFMALYGDLDKIAGNSMATGSYDEFNSPKWKVQIKGGNHSLFTDHQMYYGGGLGSVADNDPEIMRKDQMYLTISMLLPFLQRAFGMPEPFSGQLNGTFSNDKLSVTKG